MTARDVPAGRSQWAIEQGHVLDVLAKYWILTEHGQSLIGTRCLAINGNRRKAIELDPLDEPTDAYLRRIGSPELPL